VFSFRFGVLRLFVTRALGRAAGLAAVVAVFSAAVLAAPAAARSIKLHGGSFTIAFTKPVYGIFTQSVGGYVTVSNSVSAIAPAKSPRTASFAFPVTSGTLDATTFVGGVSANRRAGMHFSVDNPGIPSGGPQFSLVNLGLHFGRQSALTVTLKHGNKLTPNILLATILTRRWKRSVQGHNVTVSGLTLKLAPKGAQIFRQMGGSWKVGETLGSASIVATK
jgi:hypothetical protein